MGWLSDARLVLLLLVSLASACGPGPAGDTEPPSPTEPAADPAAPVTATATAPDGLPIAYDVRGRGDVALVFIHGWACDREFWREQVEVFDDDYRVVALDLGGNGASGTDRDAWSIVGYGADVKAVADALDLERMVLVGHSLGAPVALAAAGLLHGRVLGVVAVDSLHDAEFEFPEEMLSTMVARYETDFAGTMTEATRGMLDEAGNEELTRWILHRVTAAHRDVAVALMRDYENLDLPALFRGAGVPIRAINAPQSATSPFATDIEGNREYADFDAVIMEGTHYLHLQHPDAFNAHLRAVLHELTG